MLLRCTAVEAPISQSSRAQGESSRESKNVPSLRGWGHNEARGAGDLRNGPSGALPTPVRRASFRGVERAAA